VLLGVGIVVVVALLGAAAAVAWGLVKWNSVSRANVDLASAAVGEPQNFLVVGSDTRDITDHDIDTGAIFGHGKDAEPMGQRADSMMIVRVDPKRTSLEVLSLPRDLWVDVAGSTGHERLNAAYNKGPQNLVDTIRQNLDIDINHYVEVNFVGFKGLVEAIGGVPMYFEHPVRDLNTGLNIIATGCYNLTGQQALAFARSRHLQYLDGKRWHRDGTADLGRITRQQTFLRRSLAKVSTLGITNLNTLRKLIDVAVDTVKIDDDLSLDDLMALGRRFGKFKADQLVTHHLPTTQFRTDGGASVLEFDAAASKPLLDIFRGVAPPKVDAPPTAEEMKEPPPVPAAVTVDVLNGTSSGGLAKAAGDDLALLGFNLGTVDNTNPVTATQIRYGKGGQAAAVLVASHLDPAPGPAQLVEDPALTKAHVVVDLGPDFDQVVSEPAAPSSSTAVTSTTVPESDQAIGYTTGDPPRGVKCGPRT
jgi:LCP family protein required for cell wall assembly